MTLSAHLSRLSPQIALAFLVALPPLACSDGAGQTPNTNQPGDGDGDTSGSGGETSAGGTGGLEAVGGTIDPGPPVRDFFVLDNYENLLAYVSESEPATSFTISVPPGSRDISLLDETVLISHGDGAGEYSLETRALVWSVSGFSSVQTAQRLGNGNTLLGSSGTDATFVEVTPAGATVSTITVPGIIDLRLARVLDNGHILFTGDQGGFQAFEIDASGAIVWSAPLTGKGYEALRLENGNTLATTGETVTAIEIAPDGTIVATRGGSAAFPDAEFLWFSGFELLPSGNVLVANWHGHEMESSPGPHLVELSPTNEIVWEFHSSEFTTITNVLVAE